MEKVDIKAMIYEPASTELNKRSIVYVESMAFDLDLIPRSPSGTLLYKPVGNGLFEIFI